MDSKRFQVIEGSLSAHCCFDATVVDTTEPDIVNGEHYIDSRGRKHYKSVCECFEVSDAQRICDALNAVAEDDGA